MGCQYLLRRKMLGDRCYFTVKKWVADFKRGNDDQRSGPLILRPRTISLVILTGRRVTVQRIAYSVRINVSSVRVTLTNVLRMSTHIRV